MIEGPEFWRLIENVDREALQEGDEDSAVEPLVDALSQLGEADIRDFETILTQCLYDIDGRAYAENAGRSGQSGDGFLYARCYVVANGQTHYDNVKADPTRMPKSLDEWCEALLYVSQRAWANVTGRDEEEWSHNTPLSYETGSNAANW